MTRLCGSSMDLSTAAPVLLRAEQLTKRFPGVKALERVDLTLRRGEILAVVGENGAGKSTLGKILAGVCTADAGEIHLNGNLIHPANPLVARQLGIAMVHQELAFCPNLTVAENLCLGDLPRRLGWVDRTRMRDQARAMLHEIEADLDPGRPPSVACGDPRSLVDRRQHAANHRGHRHAPPHGDPAGEQPTRLARP